jgi:hypothetical protein
MTKNSLVSFIGAVALMIFSTLAAADPKTDAQAIEYSMKAQFDKPNAPLKVFPITVNGVYAVAGWMQGNKGGRALLKNEHGKWSIQVCSGDGLTKASTLEMTGMDKNAANKLAKAVAIAEKDLPPATLKLFASFEGMVNVQEGNHGHGHPH